MDLQMDWLNFIEKLYYIRVDQFWQHKSDNNTKNSYINRLQRHSWSLVRKIDISIITCYYSLHLKSTSVFVTVSIVEPPIIYAVTLSCSI